MKREGILKAGLLVCDHVNPDLQIQFGDYPDMFERLFPEFDWVSYEVISNQLPDDPYECDVYFTTGSRYSVYDDSVWIENVKEFIRTLYKEKIYFIGMCFGHQLLGAALGGHVHKAHNGWLAGIHSISVKQNTHWMQPKLKSLDVIMMCQDQVLILPDKAKSLAGSYMCPHAIIQVGDYCLGIQAHPEFSKAYEKKLIEMRFDLIGEEDAKLGLRSLSKHADNDTIREWVLRFLDLK